MPLLYFNSVELWQKFISDNNLTKDSIQKLQQRSDEYVASKGVVVLLAALYVSIATIAVIGNSIVIFVVIARRNMQNATNIFIANLAFADIVLGFFAAPFQWQSAMLNRWVLDGSMCKVAPFIKNVSVMVGVLTLTLVAIDRYLAVVYPLKAGFGKYLVMIILVIIWIISMGASIPQLLYHQTHKVFSVKMLKEKTICKPVWPSRGFEFYYGILSFLSQYAIPLIIITYSYIRINFRIRRHDPPWMETNQLRDSSRSRNRKKVLKMLIVVVGLFAFCWLPLQVYNLLVAVYDRKITSFKDIHIVWLCFNWLAMSNTCYNPFIYGLLNEKFKQEFKSLFRLCSNCCKEKLNINNSNVIQHDSTELTLRNNTGVNSPRINGYRRSRSF